MSDEGEAKSEPTPRLSGLAEASGRSGLAAGILALPAGFRAVAEGGSFMDGWFIAAALGVMMILPLALLASRSARGWRGVVGAAARQELLAGVGLWLSVAAVGLRVLGAVLHATTHHRGLGGAAFGITGCVLLLGSAVVAGRLVGFARELRNRGVSAKWLRTALLLGMLGAGAWWALPLGHSVSEGDALRRASSELLLTAGVTSALLWPRLPVALTRVLWATGLPVAVFLVLAGGLRMETSASARALSRSGGLTGTALTMLEGWSDRDKDGFGSHFGGTDCDEGDPKRYPGAPEAAGDGVDSDCDGHDEPETLVASHPLPRGLPSAPTAASGTPAASSVALVAGPNETGGTERPDLIVITLDTVRADRTSLHGYPKKTTPNLDKLAESGAIFDHAYAVAADTQRALMPIVSGRPLSETPHASGEWPVIDDKPMLMAERLSQAGYHTGAVTSFTWLRRDAGFAQGFDTFDESAFRENHPERKVTGARAIDAAILAHAELAAGDKPFYLWVHLFDAHSKYLAHVGSSFGPGEAGLYLGELAYVDHELGRLIEAVSKSARGKRVVWLVHGSHGEAFGEHGATGHGAQLFDEVLHVPLLIAGANVKPGHVTTAVSMFDVAQTVLALAGAKSEGIHGVSLIPAMRGEPLEHGPFVAHGARRVAVFEWPLKLTSLRLKTGKLSLSLFDLALDPGERHELAKSRPADTQRLDGLRKQADESAPGDGAPHP